MRKLVNRRAFGAYVALALVCSHIQAVAGAWTLAEGAGQVILTTSYKIAPVSALVSGLPNDDEAASQVFLEYGLFDDLTVGLTTYGNFSTVTAETDTRAGLHVRYQAWQGANGDVGSIQAGFQTSVGAVFGTPTPQDSVTEIDVRGLYGRGWQHDWANGYVSTELGYRARLGGQPDELRFDTTTGLEPWTGIIGLLNVSATYPFGEPGDASLELTPSIAYTLWPRVRTNDKKPNGPLYPPTLQFGVGVDVLNPDEGVRFSISLWRRF